MTLRYSSPACLTTHARAITFSMVNRGPEPIDAALEGALTGPS